MALNEQMQEAIQADIADESSKKERIARQTEALKDTGKFAAETVAESIPGVSQAIGVKRTSDALAEEDYVGAGIEGTALAASMLPFVGPAAAKGLRQFNKTRKAYKLFVKGEDGELYPLFVDANKPVKQGEFLEANFPDVAFKGKRKEGSQESFYVPTKGAKRSKGEKAKGTGDSILIPDEATRKKLIDNGFITERSKKTKDAPYGKVTAVAARPGWHASQAPVATHLGPQDLKVTKKEVDKLIEAGVTPEAIKRRGKQFYVKRRAEDQVFAEVDMADDVDYQSMLAKEGRSDINDRVPVGGSYKYSDGQADSDQWVVGGDMRVNRVLSREETRAIQKEMGVVDLPYRDEVESILGKKFSKGGTVMDDYLVAKTIDQTQNFAKGGVSKQMDLFEPVERGFAEGGFEDGGLKEEGGSIDPVSGNDVPPGSTQEEVRDDIPAQLSEGEFVFPADVVRYIGLEKLMQMRQEAKRGLDMMDKMGQMGNSDEAVIPDDIPFDLSDLDMEDDGVVEYAQGGVVNAQVGAFIPQGVQFTGGNTFQSQVTPSVTTPPPFTNMPVTQPPSSTYQAPTQAATPTYDYSGGVPTYDTVMSPTQDDFGGATGAAEVITIVNTATGEKRQMNFIPGVSTIPEGFVRESEYKPTEAKVDTTTGTGTQQIAGQRDDDDDPSVAPEFSTTDVTGIGYDKSKIENKDLQEILNKSARGLVQEFSVLGNVAKGLGQEAGLLKGSGPMVSAVLGGVLDQIRGGDVSFASGRKSGDYANTMSLGNMTNQQHQMIADVFKDVTVRMQDIYTTKNEKGETVKRTEPEIVERLQNVASKNYGIDLNRPNGKAKSRTTLEREIANRIAAESRRDRAKDTGQARRDEAEALAASLPSGYKIDTTGKSPEQIRKEVGQQRTKQKEDQARAEREAAAAAAEAARDFDYSSGDPDPFGGTGVSSGTDFGGTGYETSTGEAMVAEGGLMDKGKLANQMKRSGLASKK